MRQRTIVGAEEVLVENRFLAARDGIDAHLIDPTTASLRPLRDQLSELLESVHRHACCPRSVSDQLEGRSRRWPRRPAPPVSELIPPTSKGLVRLVASLGDRVHRSSESDQDYERDATAGRSLAALPNPRAVWHRTTYETACVRGPRRNSAVVPSMRTAPLSTPRSVQPAGGTSPLRLDARNRRHACAGGQSIQRSHSCSDRVSDAASASATREFASASTGGRALSDRRGRGRQMRELDDDQQSHRCHENCWSSPTVGKSAAPARSRRYRLHRKRATMSMP